MAASAPPASITSANPSWMMREASPMAPEPVAQAVTTVLLGPVAAEAHGDVPGGHVGDHHRNEQRADARGTALHHQLGLVLEGLHAADAAADQRAGALACQVFPADAAVLHGQLGGGQGQLHIAVKFFGFARLDVGTEVVVHFSGDLCPEGAGVEMGDRTDAALAGPLRLGEGAGSQADRADRPQSGDDHSFDVHGCVLQPRGLGLHGQRANTAPAASAPGPTLRGVTAGC